MFLKNSTYQIAIIFVLLTGCASMQPIDSATKEESSWGENFKQNINNASTQIGLVNREGIENQEESAKCEYATNTHERLINMKKKADETTLVDKLPIHNYWALIPIPGSKLIHLFANDYQDSLGLWNKEGCWTIKCLDSKLQITADAISRYCSKIESTEIAK